ncbi:Crp/Fnr family transcriptional regulator [Sphingomonas tabacisoli]|uniref:Crp/Fnr family transcriptional regulator n=1 Tax=Sphingomonas tabacisoli TaxID=2249466 RepID=A0ABW4I1G3_9SPHN
MIRVQQASNSLPPAALRLSRLAPLSGEELMAVVAAIDRSSQTPARRELLSEGRKIAEPRMIVSGWAARVRLLADGRRQLLSFLLPGDLVGMCRQPEPLAVSTVVAVTALTSCAAPSAGKFPQLADAYAISEALEEARLLSQIARLGRMNAQERIGDLLLELHERLSLCGLADETGFDLPLTQELLADALGLTSVHVNRVVQTMRRANDLEWRGRRLHLPNPAELARKIGRAPIRVTSASHA